MKLSIIIPTYNRAQSVLRTVRSLQEQTLADFEILVVDNAADSDLERRMTEFNRAARVPVRYVPEPQLGVHNARHAGARVAHGDLLVFTDDDHTFEPGWLEAYSDVFSKHPEMGAAGGPIRLVWETPPPQWLVDFIGDAKMFTILGAIESSDKFYLDPRGSLLSGNMAILRDVLFKTGGFNPELFGDKYLGDGEVGLYHKLWEQNVLIGYVPGAVLYHHVPPHRMTVEYFCRRMANEGAADMYSRYHRGIPDRVRLLRHAAAIVAKNGNRWLGAILLRGRTDRHSVDIQLDAARTQSQVKYVIRLMFDKEVRSLVLKKDWLNESCA